MPQKMPPLPALDLESLLNLLLADPAIRAAIVKILVGLFRQSQGV